VRRIRLNHPGGSDGFRIDDADGACLCYLTDNDLGRDAEIGALALYHHEPEADDDVLDAIGADAVR
jgi:hypothetical protein